MDKSKSSTGGEDSKAETSQAEDRDPEDPQAESEDDEAPSDDDEKSGRARFRGRLGDGLLNGLLDSGSAFKRGQDLVTGIAGGTKEEAVRIIGAEVRGFLDKMDVVDLAQEIVSGLVIDVSAQIRFKRDDEGNLQPEVKDSKTTVSDEAEQESDDKSS